MGATLERIDDSVARNGPRVVRPALSGAVAMGHTGLAGPDGEITSEIAAM